MNTLYLAWQDAKSRRWFPVGRLDAGEDTWPEQYQFSYIHGAHKARESAEFPYDPQDFLKWLMHISQTGCSHFSGIG